MDGVDGKVVGVGPAPPEAPQGPRHYETAFPFLIMIQGVQVKPQACGLALKASYAKGLHLSDFGDSPKLTIGYPARGPTAIETDEQRFVTFLRYEGSNEVGLQ